MFLKGHTFKTCQVGLPEECYFKCDEEVTCQSYNFVIGQNVCELNNRTKEARPEDFLPDRKRFYMKRLTNRENWQKINTEPVCFGARNNKPGVFNITKSGPIKTMKLIHKSGSIECNPTNGASYWGCINPRYYGNMLMTIITNANKESVLPPVGDLKALQPGTTCGTKKHFYSLDGTNHTSPELVFRDLSNHLSVLRNQELQIWYGQDLIDCSEEDNNGNTCFDVFVWYG
ncbi:hypothetical protein OS493_038116 [Desmophyllum pertusum]|uniref:Apple domain-containing protein n=1 Tax=Desmophyllum pertusum TaxID=174260 RepID=A0A9W9ZV12_9CNID|nr:hypothetical protein OS493_038116 [Desmophyllum pertusum]